MDDLTVTSLNAKYTDEIIGIITRYNVLYDINGGGIKDCRGSFWNCETCSCLVLYREKDILIEKLNSSSKGHGKILFQYVLKVLKSESKSDITLVDMSSVSMPGDEEFRLDYISLLKYGEFSWYSQFGFKPLAHGDEQQNGILEAYYEGKSMQIKSIKTIDAINIMETYSTKYPWILHITNHLKLSPADNLMIDSIRSPPFNFSLLSGYNLSHGLEEIFKFKFYTEYWHIKHDL